MNTIKKYIAIVFCLMLGVSSYAQADLNNYLITAAENNPNLKAIFKDYVSVMEIAPQVGTIPDLNLAFGYFISPVETRLGPQQFIMSASQTFPWFGKLKYAEESVIELAYAKLEVFEDAKSKLFYDVKSAYYNLYFMEKAIGITKEDLDILNTFKQLALIKFESGKVSAVDELRAEMEIADLENELAYLIDSKFQLQVQFNNLLNVDEQSFVALPDSLWIDKLKYDRSQLMDSIVVNNHSIKQIEHRILSWEKKEITSRKTGAPNFTLGVDYINIGEINNPELGPENGRDAWVAKVGISIPLYRKKYNGMVQEAVYKIESGQFEKEEKENQLSSLFELGYRDYRDGVRRVKLYKEQIILSNKALDILLAEYSTDGKDFEEVLRMEKKVLDYRLELDRAHTELNVAVAFIHYLLGE